MGETTEALLFELRGQSYDRDVDRLTGEVTDTKRFSCMDVPVALARCRLTGWRRHGHAWLRAELSLPTMLNGHNRNALDRTLLIDAVEASLILLSEDYPDIPSVERMVVQRLDVTRKSAHTTLTALSRRHVPYARVNEPRHRSDGTMQSLLRGSRKEYLVRGYDKQFELLDHARTDRAKRELLTAWATASDGLLRFELQLRAPLLRRKGLTRMTDLTPEVIDVLARDYFQHARWDAPYGGSGRVRQKLEELRPSLSRADYRNLCSYLYWVEHGMDVDLSRNVLDRVRPLARKQNLLDSEDEGEVRRLDFDSGRELPAD